MTAGDLYPFLEYSIVQLGCEGKVQCYSATRETLLEVCGYDSQSLPDKEVISWKRRWMPFLARQQQPCLIRENNDNMYCVASVTGYKAIILSDKMLLIDIPVPVSSLFPVQQGKCFADGCKGCASFYIKFLQCCLMEYPKYLPLKDESCTQDQPTIYRKAVDRYPLLKPIQQELHMFSSHLSTLFQTKYFTSCNRMDEEQRHCFKQLYHIRDQVDALVRVMESEKALYQSDVLLEKTKLIVYSFFFNILLCALLIGSTSANSFGTNLNIPLYHHSAHGPKAVLWYIVSAASIVIATCGVWLFWRRNQRVLQYITTCNSVGHRIKEE